MKTTEELMRDRTTQLINHFGADWVADRAGVDRSTIRVWHHRGRISAKAAHKICLNPAVRDAGFTREYLRPDVLVWYL